MDLRPARVDDAETIGRYHHRCWIGGDAGLVDQDVLDALDVEANIDRWRRRLEDDAHPTFVAMIDDQPVGHVSVGGDVITNLYVDPRHWRTARSASAPSACCVSASAVRTVPGTTACSWISSPTSSPIDRRRTGGCPPVRVTRARASCPTRH